MASSELHRFMITTKLAGNGNQKCPICDSSLKPAGEGILGAFVACPNSNTEEELAQFRAERLESLKKELGLQI